MTRIRIVVVVGARPQFIKSAPLIQELLSHRHRFRLTLVHSGQHYDPEMSTIFFSELKLPAPALNLRVGSGSHAYQTATIMLRLERFLRESQPDVVIAPGDTNTTLATALTGAKLAYQVAHLEAGLRSGDMDMPEEINRRLTDHCSTLLFAPTRTALANLAREGLAKDTWLTGDTMVDAMQRVMPTVKRREQKLLERMDLDDQDYVLVTLHRPSNVDNKDRLRQIIRNLERMRKVKLVFPMHPRTRKKLRNLKTNIKQNRFGICFVPPQGYVETLGLLRNAKCLLTDSGGMQKEAFLLRIPCVTLRSTTEWPETLVARANRLILDPRKIPTTVAIAKSMNLALKPPKTPFGDGTASQKIRKILERRVTVREPH